MAGRRKRSDKGVGSNQYQDKPQEHSDDEIAEVQAKSSSLRGKGGATAGLAADKFFENSPYRDIWLDEIDRVPIQVQNALLNLLSEKKLPVNLEGGFSKSGWTVRTENGDTFAGGEMSSDELRAAGPEVQSLVHKERERELKELRREEELERSWREEKEALVDEYYFNPDPNRSPDDKISPDEAERAKQELRDTRYMYEEMQEKIEAAEDKLAEIEAIIAERDGR